MEDVTKFLVYLGLITLLIAAIFFTNQTLKNLNEAKVKLKQRAVEIEQENERIITDIENKLGKPREELIIKNTGSIDEAYITEYDKE